MKPPLVVVAPLPPTRSGIADYTAELLPALAATRAVTVVVADAGAAEAFSPPEGVALVPIATWRHRPDLLAAPHLHQLGNSPDHAHVYAAVLERPGVLLLHEVVMHHLVEALTLGRGNARAYAAAMAYGYGPGGRRLVRLREEGFLSEWQRFLLPLHRHLVDASRGVLVHSRYAASRVETSRPTPVRVVPHHLPPAIADLPARASARETLGLPAATPVLLILGHVTPPKQVTTALRALAALRERAVPAILVIGGALAQGSPIPELIEELGLGDLVRVTGWLDTDDFFRYLCAADLLLALRFPSGGESSGTLARALAVGLPAIVFDHGPASEYPDEVLYKLPFAIEASQSLADAVAMLLADPARRAALGLAAAAHMRAAASLEDAAAAIVAAIDDWA